MVAQNFNCVCECSTMKSGAIGAGVMYLAGVKSLSEGGSAPAAKVEEKLAKAKEKYDIPASYEPVMKGFFTSYMTEVYKAGRDTVAPRES